MAARGRRAAFITGYAAAGLGGLITATSTAHREIAAMTGGMLLLGLGNAAAQLSRYAAAEMYPPHRRAAAISALLCAVTVGAVGGPLLLAPSGSMTAMLGGRAAADHSCSPCSPPGLPPSPSPASQGRGPPAPARPRDVLPR